VAMFHSAKADLGGTPKPVKSGDNTGLIDGLTEISASMSALCIQIGGFSKNLVTPAFYENHTFLNLIQKYFIDERYEIDEAIRKLGGWALDTIEDVTKHSQVSDPSSRLTDPAEIVNHLIPQFKIMISLSQKSWALAIQNKEPAIVGLNISLSDKLTHFQWELKAQAGKYK